MIHQLLPWRTLTRMGIPALKVARRPLVIGEVTIPVGTAFNPELFPLQIRAERLRQFYEARLPGIGGRIYRFQQFYREQLARAQGQEVPVAPIQPVASRIVADLPAVEVPVAEDPRPKPKPKGAK